MKNPLLVLASMLFWSCFDHSDQYAGVVITENTIATDSGTVQVQLSSKTDTTAFFGALRSAARIQAPTQLNQEIQAAGDRVLGAWDFAKADSTHFINQADGRPTMVMEQGAWASLRNGVAYFDDNTCVRIPHQDSYLADSLSLQIQIFPTAYSVNSMDQVLIHKGKLDADPASVGMALYLTPRGTLKVLTKLKGESSVHSLESLDAVALNQWALVRMDLGKTGLSLWMNQKQLALASFGSSAAVANAQDFYLGCAVSQQNGGPQFVNFSGLIDFVDLVRTLVPVSSSSSSISSSSSGLSSSSAVVLASNEFQDARDGQVYKAVAIGNQVWMGQNLNYVPAGMDGSGAWCYEGNSVNCAQYGHLYSWATAMALSSNCENADCASQVQSVHQGICPAGWHMPTDAEWASLYQNLGGVSTAAAKLKTSAWGGDNSSGFGALPAGQRTVDGLYSLVDAFSGYWSSTQSSVTGSWRYGIYADVNDLIRSQDQKSLGLSVRCVKN